MAVGVVYAFFAASCFRLALVNGNEVTISIGEGLFTLLGRRRCSSRPRADASVRWSSW